MEKINHYLKNIPLTTFLSVNQFIKFVIVNFLLKPFNALLVALAFGVMTIFSTVTAGLDFELFGKKYTFGSDLSEGLLGVIGFAWSAVITFVESYEPSSPFGFPLEVLTESLALFLSLLGFIIPVLIDAISAIFSFVFLVGIGVLIEFISWLYLIGASVWIYQKYVGVREKVKISKLENTEKPET